MWLIAMTRKRSRFEIYIDVLRTIKGSERGSNLYYVWNKPFMDAFDEGTWVDGQPKPH